MTGLSDNHAEWLENRKLSVEVAVEMGVHSRGPSIAFAYMEGKNLLYVKARDPKDKKRTFCHPSGVLQNRLWNEDCLSEEESPTDPLIITEGEPDAVAVKQVGYRYVVSLPSGAANSLDGCRSKARKCLTIDDNGEAVLKPDVAKFKRVIIMTDGDADGLFMRQAIVEIVGEEYCWVPEYPSRTKDANDVLMREPVYVGETIEKDEERAQFAEKQDTEPRGAEGLRHVIDNARPVKDDGFVDFITAEKITSPLRPLSCGIPFLEPHFKPVRPSFIVIGGQAGHGKSTITQAILFNILHANEGLRASIFHAEGDKTIPIQRAKKFWKGKTSPLHMDDRVKMARDSWVGDRLGFISTPQGQTPTFEWLLWAMERQALYRKRNVFVIDPWNQVSLKIPSRASKTDYVGECIYEMKRLGDRYGLIIIVAHHTTKAIDPRQPPTRYDLADSAHWVNASDHLLLGWKPVEGENITRLEVAKSKDHDKMGRPGHIWVSVDGPTFALQNRVAPKGFDRKSKDDGDPTAQPPQPSRGPDAGGDLIADLPEYKLN